MKKILLVLSSVREGRAADNILSQVQTELKNYPDIEATVADFTKLPLPLIDTGVLPSADDYAPEDKNVQEWARLVSEADAVVFLVAEYNYSFTAILKNAIDWLFKPWNGKPVSFIGYGWAGGSRAIKHLRDVMNSTLAAQVAEPEANLRFTKEIDLEGKPLTEDAAAEINKVLGAL